MKKILWSVMSVAALGFVLSGCGGGTQGGSSATQGAPEGAGQETAGAPAAATGEVAIQVTDRGFEPARPVVKKGEAVTLVFTRTTEQTCAVDVMFPRLGTKVDLPMNQAVRVEIPAGAVQDTLYFACGMNMITGMVVAE